MLGAQKMPRHLAIWKPLQLASPGQWENLLGDLDPFGIGAEPHVKTGRSKQFLKLHAVRRLRKKRRERGEGRGDLDHRHFRSDSANSRSTENQTL